MELADALVAELAIEGFFNIQLVGELVIEINPRISTIVYQDDLNLPYLGVKRALGEISADELVALRERVRPGRASLRYFDQVDFDGPVVDSRTHAGPCPSRYPLPGQHGRRAVDERPGAAATRRGRAARRLRALPAPPRGGLEPRPARRLRPQAGGAVACARAAAAAHGRLPLLLRAHARAEVAPVPDPAGDAQEVASSTTSAPTSAARHASELAFGRRADAEIVGSYDAIRWVPDAEVIPPGHRPDGVRAGAAVGRTAGDRARALVAAAAREPSTCSRRAQASTPSSRSSRACTMTRRESATGARTSSSTS